MPLPQTIRVNPLDLRRNIAIGVSLPFKGPFTSTFTTKDQIKSNLINLLLTNKGERVMNPTFGCDIKKQLFQNITTDLQQNIINIIVETIESNLRKDAPTGLSTEDLDKFIEFGRPALVDTATEIADKILA